MSGGGPAIVEVHRARGAPLEAALPLLTGHWQPDDRPRQVEKLLGELAAADDLLLSARRGDRVLAAALLRFQPGATAFAWTPRLTRDAPAGLAPRLLQAAVEAAGQRATAIVQGLTEIPSATESGWFARAGFEHAADLVYLLADESSFPAAAPEGDLQYEAGAANDTARLAQLVDATYAGTLDCPRLNGVRTADEVLAGYRATGTFRPDWWLFVRHEGRDVGCLLVNDHPDPQRPGGSQAELVYLGLMPEARGRGWGREVTRQAQWLARQAGRSRMLLAVDEANAPALAAYGSAGFAPLATRAVHMRVLRGRLAPRSSKAGA